MSFLITLLMVLLKAVREPGSITLPGPKCLQVIEAQILYSNKARQRRGNAAGSSPRAGRGGRLRAPPSLSRPWAAVEGVLVLRQQDEVWEKRFKKPWWQCSSN